MAERLVRLFGPAFVSSTKASPTTLFTVPTNKTYLIRSASIVLPPSAGGAAQGTSFVAGINGVDTDDLIMGLGAEGSVVGASTEQLDLVTPVVAGENVKGYYNTGGSGPTYVDFAASTAISWQVASTTDATSYASAAFTSQELGDPTNVYWVITNTKASSPDAVSSIADAHTNPVTNIGSIVSQAGATGRVSIWGGYAGTDSSGSAAYTTTYGGTQTSHRAKAMAISNAALAAGTPSTSNVILQTATATGTTATSQPVTMTPTAGADSWQLLVVQTNASTSYTSVGGVELGVDVRATPTSTASIFFYYPAVTNPTPVAAGAGTEYSVACIEGASAGAPAVTISGLVIE